MAPNVGALTTASNAAGAAGAAAEAASSARNRPTPQQLPSIITVEVVGYGGGDGTQPAGKNGSPHQDQRRRRSGEQTSYDPSSAFHVIGNGELTLGQKEELTQREKSKLDAMADRSVSP